MKKILSLICIVAALALGQSAPACVGKTLYIGVTGAPNELLFAEMISVLVNERTGTSVKIKTFRDAGEMYAAVKRGEVGVFVEEPGRALKMLARPAEGNAKAAYDNVRKESRKSLNLVWLEPFGVKQYYAPVLSLETIGNLPALPKLLNKLGGVVNDDGCARLLRSARGEEQMRKSARDFLKSRKLI
ncbi:MAG TPA: glycine betaine ABC transporter substrate-binding protein [Desulfuromonadaceae bacterium]